MFTLKELILLSIAGMDVGLAFYVISKNPGRVMSWLFSAIPFGSGVWAFALAMFSYTSGVLVWERIIFGSSLFIFPLLVIFSDAFPDKTRVERWYLWLFLPTFVLLLAPFFGLVLEAYPVVFDSRVLKITSPLLHPLYNTLALTYLTWTIFNLLKKYRRARAVVKLQLSYLLFGLFIFVLFGFVSNLLLPLLKESEFIMLGPASSLIFCTFATYAIVRYRLMDIRTALQRGVVVLVLVAAAPSLFFTIFQLLRQLVPIYSSSLLFLTACLSLLILLLCGTQLVRLFLKFTERLFFRGTYIYPEMVAKLTKIYNEARSIEEFSTKITEVLVTTFKTDRAIFLLKDRSGRNFFPIYTSGITDHPNLTFYSTDDLINYARREGDVFLAGEIEEGTLTKGALKQLKRLGVDLGIPIEIRGKLEGLICLGRKSSGEPYTTRDISLLRIVSDLAGVALESVKLYASLGKGKRQP